MMAGAVLEGTVFNIRANIELMESLGRECSGINVFGGGSNSSIWLRMIADATGKTVKKTQIEETACLGAAMKAAESVGISRRNLPNGEIEIKPDSTIKKEYDAKYMKYKDIEYKLYGR
jgi:xylulokinase